MGLLTLEDFPGAPEVVEDAGTFAGNATKKAVGLAKFIARSAAASSGESIYVLADDSGLEVDALGGAPGVHSARFAALDSGGQGNSPDKDNLAKLLRLLKDVPQQKRTARFRCVIALTPLAETRIQNASPVCLADEFELQTELFEGKCEGHISFSPTGDGGFGYDPVFVPIGHNKSFGELSPKIKNRLSHRARALEKVARFLASRKA